MEEVRIKHLIVYTHPNPQSFNHAVLETVVDELKAKNLSYGVRDLYKSGFNPVLSSADLEKTRSRSVSSDIHLEQKYIAAADRLIFIYPLWWSGLPAMLKGYIDRVFTEGFAYRMADSGIEGLLNKKKVFLITTSGASRMDYEESGFFDSMSQVIDTGIFQFCGLELIGHIYLCSVPYITAEDRKQMLLDLRKTVREKII